MRLAMIKMKTNMWAEDQGPFYSEALSRARRGSLLGSCSRRVGHGHFP